MNFDPRFTTIRDRCRQLAVSIKVKRQQPTAQDVAQIAEDLGVVADELNKLLNRLENGQSDSRGNVFKDFRS